MSWSLIAKNKRRFGFTLWKDLGRIEDMNKEDLTILIYQIYLAQNVAHVHKLELYE